MRKIIGIPVLQVNRYSGMNRCDNTGMSIGTRLKEARIAADMTQAELAARSGVKQSTISDLEVGKSRGTTYVAQMATVLGVNALWLETGKGDMNAKTADEADPAKSARLRLIAPDPGMQWISAEEYRLLSNYRAATAGWKLAIQDFAEEAEKEPLALISDHKR